VPESDRPYVEHLIVHDGSDSYAAALKKRHPHVAILRGEGRGPAAAAALGARRATGDFVFFLNSDDRLVRGSVGQLIASAMCEPDVQIWTGGTRVFRTDKRGHDVTVRVVDSLESTELSLANLMDDLPLLTARFCRRSVYEAVGGLDPDYAQSSDREFMIRVAFAGFKDRPLNVMVSELREHEGSLTINRRRNWVPPYLEEHIRIADCYLAKPCTSARTKAVFRNWRARETLRLLIYELSARQWRAAAGLAIEASARDASWWLRAATTVAAVRRRRRRR
jgi:GT2 family glycosyltransferase